MPFRERFRDLNYWDVVAIVAGTFTLILFLGEYVFHGWAEPGDAAGLASVMVTVLAAGFSASKRGIRHLIDHIDKRFDEMLARQARMLELQERMLATLEGHTPLLEESVQFFGVRSRGRAWAKRHRVR